MGGGRYEGRKENDREGGQGGRGATGDGRWREVRMGDRGWDR